MTKEKIKHVVIDLETHTKIKTLAGAWKMNMGHVVKKLLKEVKING